MPTIRLFHGTAHGFESFDGLFARRGTEPNSALGVHLTERPELAAHYARLAARDRGATASRVLVVEVEAERVAIVSRRDDFMGRSDDLPLEATRPWSDFVEARHRLLDEGYAAIAGDELGDDLEGCWVALDPSVTTLVGMLTPDEAEALGEEWEAGPWPEVGFESVELFEDEPTNFPAR